MALENLRESLRQLNRALVAPGRHNPTKDLAEDVENALRSLPDANASFASGLMFDKDIGILSFLRATRGNSDHDEAKRVLCVALAAALLQHPECFKARTREIQTVCQDTFKNAKWYRLKEASLAPLLVLVDPRTRSSDPDQLDILKLFANYFQVYMQQQSKLASSVKSEILKLLSLMCRFHWDTIHTASSGYPKQLCSIIMQGIGTLWDAKGPDFRLAERALSGINDLMFCPIDTDVEATFGHVKKILTMLNPTVDFKITRYAVPCAGLQLLIDHADKFSAFIMGPSSDSTRVMCQELWEDVSGACFSPNSDLEKFGYRAADSLLKTVASALCGKGAPENATALFWWFMNRLSTLMSKDAGSVYKPVSLAVRGYGFLAPACVKLAGNEQFLQMLRALIKRSSQLLISDPQNREQSVFVPSFLEAFAYMAPYAANDSEFVAAVVELGKCMLLRFPFMHSAYQGLSAAALRNLLRALYDSGPAGTAIWSSLSYEAVLLTSICRGPSDLDASDEFAFEDYINFWAQIFRPVTHERSLAKATREFDDMLYDATIRAALQLVQNLDLSFKEAETSSGAEGGDDGALTANNPVDLSVLLTFARFLDRFLTNTRPERFTRWMYIMGSAWIELSLRNPNISTFLDLFSCVLKLAESLSFFKNAFRAESKGMREPTEDELTDKASSAQRSAYLLFARFIKNLAVQSHALKDDMMAACLRVLLVSPVDLLCVRDVINPICMAIRLGLSFPPLADAAIEALERWIVEFPHSVLLPAYRQTLPLLLDYLTTDAQEVQQATQTPSKLLKLGQRFRMQNVAMIRNRITAAASTASADPGLQLKMIRSRIVMLLGRIGGDNRLMLEGNNNEEQQIIAWDTEKRLAFEIPFKEINCQLYLDDILPRVVELAENSPDRQTKVAAAELLHGCVVLMIGRSAKTLSNTGRNTDVKKSPFHKLYKNVFPALLRLGADLDRVTRELFSSLVFQIIHWLTKNSRAENPETMAMLNACLDAISAPIGGLRNFAGDCVREFVIWSIKHTSVKDQESNPVNVKSLLKRLYRLLVHANVHKRMGGSMAFGKIYRVIREETSLVDQFSFEIIYYLLMGLRLAENDNPAFGTQSAMPSVISHWIKIVKNKADTFRRASSARRPFPGLKTATLDGLVEWVFDEISRPEIAYAQNMMLFFIELAPAVSSPREWVNRRIAEDPLFFLTKVFEKNGFQTIPTEIEFREKKAQQWSSQLVTTLNAYTFLLDARIVDTKYVLTQKSAVTVAASFFVENYAKCDDHEFSEDPNERLQANQCRSLALSKILGFVDSVLRREPKAAESLYLWSPRFFEVIALCIFKPRSVGFSMESEDVKQALPERMETLLKIMNHNLQPKWKELLIRSMNDVYSSSEANLTNFNAQDSRLYAALTQTVRGLRQVQKAGLMVAMSAMRHTDIAADAFAIVNALSQQKDPATKVTVGELLRLCLDEASSRDKCMQELLGFGKEGSTEEAARFYQQHQGYITAWCAEHFDNTAKLLAQYSFDRISYQLFLGIVEMMILSRTTNKRLAKSFMSELVKNHEMVKTLAASFSWSDVLGLWKTILRLDPKILAHQKGTAFAKVFSDVFLRLLDPGTPLATVNQVLGILPEFLSAQDHVDEIEKRLQETIINHFPLNPTAKEVQDKSGPYADYAAAMEHLLKALEITGSANLTRCLVTHVCRMQDHPYAPAFGHSVRAAVKRLLPSDLTAIVTVLFQYFKDSSFPMYIRRNVVQHALRPLLSEAPKSVVREALASNIATIMETIADPLGPRIKDRLLEKTAAFELVDLCYTRLDVDDVHSTTGAVVLAYTKGKLATGKELSAEVMRLGNQAKNENVGHEDDEVARVRLSYHQAAYNAVAAAVLLTQSNQLAKFCNGFLFKESLQHWNNIIDLKANMSEILGSAADPQAKFEPVSRQHLSKQYLTESSLSQTSSMTLAAEGPAEGPAIEASLNDAITQDEAAASPTNQSQEALVWGEHPCIARIVIVVQRLSQNGAAADNTWIKALHSKMIDPDSALNVRLFVACIVLNVPDAFRSSAQDWWRPMAMLLPEYCDQSQTIDNFCRRLLLVLLQWAGWRTQSSDSNGSEMEGNRASFKPAENADSIGVFSVVTESLVRHALSRGSQSGSPGLAEVKRNLDMVGAVIETWPKLATPPTNHIYRLITGSTATEILAGMYASALFIGNRLSPYYQQGLENVVTQAQFWSRILGLLKHTTRKVYVSAAEVLGRWLALATENSPENAAELLDELRKKLSGIGGVHGSVAEQERFVRILASLGIAYSDVVKDFARELLSILPQLANDVRRRCLYAICSCAPEIPDLFEELRGKGLLGLIQHNDDAARKLVLVILYNLAPKLRSDQVEVFLPTIISIFPQSTSEQCRQAFYSLLREIYDHMGENEPVGKQVRTAILGGLSDVSRDIRQGVLAYLQQHNQFANTTIFDKLRILLEFYQPQLETSYLHFTTAFLLSAAKESPQYSAPLFDSGLPDAKFVDTTIDCSWGAAGSYAATQNSAAHASVSRSQRTSSFQNLRATQQLQWSLTQDLKPAQARDIFSLAESEVTSGLNEIGGGQGFGPERPIARRGSLSDSVDQRRHFAMQTERRLRIKRSEELAEKTAHAHTVTLARNYRAGELPDIEIQRKGLIDPLQDLARRDPDVAQHLLSALVASIYDRADDSTALTGEQPSAFKLGVEKGLQTIMRSSVICLPAVMKAVMRAIYETSVTGCDPQAIFYASTRSSNSQMGILLLEKCVSAPRAPSSKRARTSRSGDLGRNAEAWLQLARSYKSVADTDTYRAIVEHRISTISSVKDAISAETSMNFEKALIKYQESLEIEGDKISKSERDICHDGQGECLDNLGLYDEMAVLVMQDIDNDTSKLWDESFQDPYLKLFFRAYLRLWKGYTEGGIFIPWEGPSPLSTFARAALEDPKKRQILETVHTTNMCLLKLADGDVHRSRDYCQLAIDEFLMSFGSIHPAAREARLSKLSTLQLLVEVKQFADLYANNGPTALISRADSVLKGWHTRPSVRSSMVVWQDLILARKSMIDIFCQLSKDNATDVFEDALKRSYEMIREAAQKQLNFAVATHYTQHETEFNAESLYATLKLAFNRLTHLDDSDKADLAGRTLDNFAHCTDQIASLSAELRADYLELEGRVWSNMVENCIDAPDFAAVLLENKYVRKAARKAGFAVPPNTDALVAFARARAFTLLNEARLLDAKTERNLMLAAHCDIVLGASEDNPKESTALDLDMKQYAETVMTCVLNVMQKDPVSAIEKFPRLLQLLELHPTTTERFVDLSRPVPPWTFLRWLPQMTALLDKPSASALLPVVTRVAEVYPAALYFPLSISSEQYVFSDDQASRQNRAEVAKLQKLACGSLSLLEKFKVELKRLTEPFHVFKDWFEQTATLIKAEFKNPEAILDAFAELKMYCLSDDSMGEVGLAFARSHAAKIYKVCGKDGSRLVSMTTSGLRDIAKCYTDIDKSKTLQSGGMVALKRYSPWLARFNARDHMEDLEMPGQYTGVEKPRPDEHIKISSFHSEVLVMGSMRRPKRLTIIGSDEVEYQWLVKGGEDLRLDQRVEEMFSTMNSIMRENGRCGDLALRTYKVIPMSTTLGMLEWVPNTKPLREVLTSMPGYSEEQSRAENRHDLFVRSFSKSGATPSYGELYGNMFKGASRSKVVEHLSHLASSEPYLSHWMQKLAASPEAFLTIRATFAKSLAALTICSYILGIGDRHLENFLIDMGTGELVGIDFGHAFGSATTVLPIPELVPFRLTRQLELALIPLGTSVLLENTMVNVLAAMREGKDVLLNVLNIFVKEPLMEWRKFALKQAQKQGKSASGLLASAETSLSAPEWYSQQKLDIAKRKLDGDNPAHIMAQELEWGHGTATWFKAARDILLATGSPSENRRAQAGPTCKSVKEQVECLIDQATDPNILGRMYIGWGAWS
ncbi:hypothetical protein HDU87_005028 [Geranomyces variabilis]|uniref:non-specific serine/threonine protein kinase n=1 Tax=Geranomyces variabilis TaxID=109894 RepID=A0AAD5TQI6_9FUNG|nr:hypothetical protein HDU87_005028 [Geranomyces variabilis]